MSLSTIGFLQPCRRARAGTTLRLALLAMLLTLPQLMHAHGDLDVQIDEVSAEIDARPTDAQLYLKRAELYRNVEHFLFASDDLEQAEKLDPALPLVHLARARNFLEWGKPTEGLPEVERYLEAKPEGQLATLAHEVRGHLLAAVNRPQEAADEFSLAISSAASPTPDLYMYRVAAYEAAGEQNLPSALASLEEGVARLGPIVSLMQPALELEIRLHRYDAALARIDRLSATLPRAEAWLARRGEVHLLAGDRDQARASFEQALERLAALSPRQRDTQATQQLEQQIRRELREISDPAVTASHSITR